MQNSTLIFIPDISGFTKFVNKTAIEHSQHIISELLEIIINSNNLDLKISEIEGDAILFYKNDSIPQPNDIIQLSKEMFLRFHSHLKDIEKKNVCQCGACRTASNLSLKFITHLGELKEVNVNKFNKLIGSDLILAHRLLKNNIDSHEYLLMSDKYFENFSLSSTDLEQWIKIKPNKDEFDNFGEVYSKYIDFSPLLDKLSDYINDSKIKQTERKPDIKINIDAPILLVHEALTDINAKYNFVPGIKKIVTKDKINRVDTSHTCVFENLEIHFVTKKNSVQNKSIFYSEEAQFTNGLKFIADYQLQDLEGKTELLISFINSDNKKSDNNSILNKIKNFFFLKIVIFKNKNGIQSFKRYCENKYEQDLAK